MVSPWQLPLPTGECTTVRVVVCFYSDRWIPISCFSYSEAIALYHKALLKDMEILVFPTDLDLETKNILLTESPWKSHNFTQECVGARMSFSTGEETRHIGQSTVNSQQLYSLC